MNTKTEKNLSLLSLDDITALVRSGEAATSKELVEVIIASLVGTQVRELELEVADGGLLFCIGFGEEGSLEGPSLNISVDAETKNLQLGFGLYRLSPGDSETVN